MTKINRLRSFSNSLPRHSFLTIYKTNILPIFDYGSIIYDNCSDSDKHLDKAQLSAAKIILGCLETTSSSDVLLDLNLKTLIHRREISILRYFSKIIFRWYPALCLWISLDRSVNLFPTLCATTLTFRFHFSKNHWHLTFFSERPVACGILSNSKLNLLQVSRISWIV